MTLQTEIPPTHPLPPPGEGPPPPWQRVARSTAGRAIGALVLLGLAIATFSSTFDFLRDADANRFVVVAVAIAVGVGGVFLLFWGMDRAVNLLPERYREGVRPYVFVGPALVMLSVFLIYPVVNTVVLSFKDGAGRTLVVLERTPSGLQMTHGPVRPS